MNSYHQVYESKFDDYFSGARRDMLNRLPERRAGRILEIGCGFGETGRLALKQGKCGEYFGIEVSPKAAAHSKTILTQVICADVEGIDLPWPDEFFDVVILSEVLEHLVDPWSTLTKVYKKTKIGGVVLASSPNVSQWRLIRALISGKWELEDSGLMDRTHLRWFTPESYASMFRNAGFEVRDIQPVTPFSTKARFLNSISMNKFEHLIIRQIFLEARKN